MQALQGLTISPAWAAGEEQHAGRMVIGYHADLAVLADNPHTVPDADLAGLPVLLTVVDEHLTHHSPGL